PQLMASLSFALRPALNKLQLLNFFKRGSHCQKLSGVTGQGTLYLEANARARTHAHTHTHTHTHTRTHTHTQTHNKTNAVSHTDIHTQVCMYMAPLTHVYV